MGMPGPMEILIILAVLGAGVAGIVVLIVAVTSASRKKSQDHAAPGSILCPHCNHSLSPQAAACPACGQPIGGKS